MDTLDGVGDFFAAFEQAGSLEEIESALFAVTERLGFSYVSYICGSSGAYQSQRTLVTNYPAAWRSHYRAMRYDLIDPIVSMALAAIEPFQWSDPLVRARMSPKQLRVLEEARSFRLGEGYVAPLHAALSAPAFCIFVAEYSDLDPAACTTARRVGIVAHEYIARIARRGEVGCNGTNLSPQLSPRERACLEAFARGATDMEIAASLGLRLPTVRRHFEQVRRRLQVSSRPEALVRALFSRQLSD